ncbi:PREDICTED: uncharacterized protein LOC109193531 [Ipomoea nil]|uniref:uncharacterized protein LOC109193531 n=1 Tax=Ipomoea nil TaxID=35883 RepID=UPI0009012FF0|nr:PREDICTED: uncharacterized protein LOC109193531 [Ipomoea nil]
MVSRKKPDFVYLMETKVDRSHAERLRIKIGFEGLFYVDQDRRGGGLALLWKKNNTARLLSYSKNYVDVERHRRREAWQLLSGLRDKSTLPWVALGDFNDLLYQREKRGGNPHPVSLLRGFGDTVYNFGLVQLPMRGHQFTWEKGKGTDRWMEERLDKVLVSTRWTTLHTEAWVENILTRKSDHSTLFLNTDIVRGRRHGGPKQFCFEMAWVHDDGCRGVVETAWQDSRDKGLLICQQHCGGRLMRWGGEHWHKFGDRIKQLRKEQDELRHRRDSAALAEFRDIEERLGQVEMQEDVFWRQRAKQHWLRGADCNTKFYHRYVSARRRKNYIPRLKNDVGAWVEGDNMRKVVLEYYAAIFTSSNTECEDLMLDNFAPRVTSEQNTMLLRQFELEEVKNLKVLEIWDVTALFAMFRDKAPGPDGSLPEGLNDTNVVLIPKKDVPETVADMRPIALSNVLYRIMAKVTANRMKPLMGNLISEAQSAFIPGRLITDNILIAAECLGRYEELSGQKVNYHKSSVCFSRNTSVEDREVVASCLQAGKEILLKSVAQSIPTFSMSVFLIPDTVCLSIQRTMNKYWWGTGMDRGIHWKAWDKLSIPKKYGGMGFKDLKNFNLAMLGKQAWRLLTSPDTLVAKVYKARYYPNTTFIDVKIGGYPSHSWRSIMAAHDMVVARTDMPVELKHAKVVGLIDEQTATWDPHILADLFDEEDLSRILRIPVSPGYEDSWNIMGIYDHSPGVFEKWTKMWGMKIPPKWKTFLWRAICDILPTTNNLIIKRVEVDPTCQMCGLAHENVMHTFINCDYSRHVWNISGLPITNIVVNSFPEWLIIVLTMFTEGSKCSGGGIALSLMEVQKFSCMGRHIAAPYGGLEAGQGGTALLPAGSAPRLGIPHGSYGGQQRRLYPMMLCRCRISGRHEKGYIRYCVAVSGGIFSSGKKWKTIELLVTIYGRGFGM